MINIVLASVPVDDTGKALKFYTEKLGFVTKVHIPEINWVTIVSQADPDGTQLLLEPDDNPVLDGAVKELKKKLVKNGIAYAAFAVDDIHKETERLKKLGVKFTQEPTPMGPTIQAVFDDTCGNLVQLFQLAG